jgi:hypothetical protein
MAIQDKRDLLSYIQLHHEEESFEIELGCGNRKRSPTAIGIDRLDYPGVDIVGEIGDVLAKIPEGSIATRAASYRLWFLTSRIHTTIPTIRTNVSSDSIRCHMWRAMSFFAAGCRTMAGSPRSHWMMSGWYSSLVRHSI